MVSSERTSDSTRRDGILAIERIDRLVEADQADGVERQRVNVVPTSNFSSSHWCVPTSSRSCSRYRSMLGGRNCLARLAERLRHGMCAPCHSSARSGVSGEHASPAIGAPLRSEPRTDLSNRVLVLSSSTRSAHETTTNGAHHVDRRSAVTFAILSSCWTGALVHLHHVPTPAWRRMRDRAQYIDVAPLWKCLLAILLRALPSS